MARQRSRRNFRRRNQQARRNRRLFSEQLEPRWLLAANLIVDLNPGTDDGFFDDQMFPGQPLSDLEASGGYAFFQGSDGSGSGYGLWKTDGTPAGTVLVKDIVPGPNQPLMEAMPDVNGTLFFVVDDGVNGEELWKSDGTAAATMLVKDINPGPGDGLMPMQWPRSAVRSFSKAMTAPTARNCGRATALRPAR